MTSFKELSLIPPLLRAVADAGYTQPSPIQEKAIPPVLAGRDLLGCAQTGTGKTAAFALPILQLLAAKSPAEKEHRAIRALILTPTRELALQIQESFETYGKYLKLRSTVIFGGVGQAPQVEQLKRGVDVLVATPGRLNDLIGQGFVKLHHLEIFVLDEADRMLDMGFVQDVRKVLRILPVKKQTLLFSATMPDEIVQLANSLLQKPAKVFVTPVSSTVETIEQSVYKVDRANKRHLLAQLLRDPGVKSVLVFTRTKHGADRVVRELSKAGIQAKAIHGNKSQTARQDALARLKDGRVQVLVATDIAARGLDINELSHVVNYDLPNVPETYVHRIGRTGRAGHGGRAISFCHYEELPFLDDIEKLIGFKVPEVTGHDWPMQVFEKTEKPAGRGGAPAAPKAEKKPKTTKPAKPAKTVGPRQSKAESTQKKEKETPKNQNPRKNGAGPNRDRRRPPPFDPYENLQGGQAIITKRPVWSTGQDEPALPAGQNPRAQALRGQKGDDDMSRNNRRRSKNHRSGKNNPKEAKAPPVPENKKNEKGVFDFSEEELAQDQSLKVISRKSGDEKFASFEDFLKEH